MKEKTEIELQKAVHKILSDPSIVRESISGKRLQILSPGRHNVYAGPDFKEIAVLIDSNVVVGDAEFHRNSTEWFKHKHDKDKNYENVILHIVLDDDNKKEMPFETLTVNKIQLQAELARFKADAKEDLDSIQDLQDYALVRILRKTSDAMKVLEFSEINNALKIIVSKYLEKYNKRRKRPIYTSEDLKKLILDLESSLILEFLISISEREELKINELLPSILKKKISMEGKNLRQEILLNCVLPIAICLSHEEDRISLFLWYWSTLALNQYGLLSRRFPNIPQNYIWQQQGMLEFMRDVDKKPNVISEIIKDYGFAEVLSFYRIGRTTIDL